MIMIMIIIFITRNSKSTVLNPKKTLLDGEHLITQMNKLRVLRRDTTLMNFLGNYKYD